MKLTTRTETIVTSIEDLEMLIAAIKGMDKPFKITAHVGVELDNLFALPAANPAIDAMLEKAQVAIEAMPTETTLPKLTAYVDPVPAPTRAELLDLLKRASGKLGAKKVEQVLLSYGGKRLSEVAEDQWAAIRDNLMIQMETVDA
jgi:hypothetical protein